MNAVTDIFSPEMQYKVVNSFQCLLYYSAQCCYLTSGRCFAGSPPVHLITCLSVACLNLSGMKAKHLATQTLLRVHSSITPPHPHPQICLPPTTNEQKKPKPDSTPSLGPSPPPSTSHRHLQLLYRLHHIPIVTQHIHKQHLQSVKLKLLANLRTSGRGYV